MVDIQNMAEGNFKKWLVLFLLLYEQIYIYLLFLEWTRIEKHLEKKKTGLT